MELHGAPFPVGWIQFLTRYPPVPDQTPNSNHPGTQIERVTQSIRTRWNPIREATPARLGSEVDSLFYGRLTIARFWEAMQESDDMLRPVDGKRKDAVEGMEWQILLDDDAVKPENQELAKEQKEVLAKFYCHLTVTHILKQDQQGGVGLLARNILDARAKGWAVHEWIWQPRAVQGEYTTATFRFCPLYWFENTTGKLRFLESDTNLYGVDMPPGEWLVAASDNYMRALTAAWLMKQDLLRAWIRFCERFGMPVPHAKTGAQKDSETWETLVEAVQAYNEGTGLVTSEDATIELLEAKNIGTNNPFLPLLERIDRMIAVVVMGSDLSTISAGSGQGQGASLQDKEDSKREKADASFVSETLNRHVDRAVLKYYFGEDVPVLARFALIPPRRIDSQMELAVDQFAVTNGVPIGADDFRSRYGRPKPPEGADILRPVYAANPTAPAPAGNQPMIGGGQSPQQGQPATNQVEPPEEGDLANATMEQRDQLIRAAEKQAAAARADDLLNIAEQLTNILDTAENEQQAARMLQKWIAKTDERYKRLLSRPSHLSHQLEQILSAALLNGLQTEPK